MSDYYNVTTNNGDAAIATAIANNTKLNITHIAFGDGNGAVPTPNKARTTLVKEVYRQAVAKYERHPTIANYLIVEVVIPSDIGGFYIREIGLIADGILISHGSHAPFYKVAEPNGVSEFHLKYTINIQDGGVVDLILDESLIYATEAWVDENYVPRNQIVDNLITDDSTKPVSAKQALILNNKKLDAALKQYSQSINYPSFINLETTSQGTPNQNVGTAGLHIPLGDNVYGFDLVGTQGDQPRLYMRTVLNKQNNPWVEFISKALNASQLLNQNGYSKLLAQDGTTLILQWGMAYSQNTLGANTNTNLSFPISFPNACLRVFAVPSNAMSGNHNTASAEFPTNSGFTLVTASGSGGASNYSWFALGY